MSEICDGPLCYRAMIISKPKRDVNGDICVFLRHKHRRHIFAVYVKANSEISQQLINLRIGDEVYVPYSCDIVGDNIIRNNPFMRLWNRLFW